MFIRYPWGICFAMLFRIFGVFLSADSEDDVYFRWEAFLSVKTLKYNYIFPEVPSWYRKIWVQMDFLNNSQIFFQTNIWYLFSTVQSNFWGGGSDLLRLNSYLRMLHVNTLKSVSLDAVFQAVLNEYICKPVT